jgi:hypothetical protein
MINFSKLVFFKQILMSATPAYIAILNSHVFRGKNCVFLQLKALFVFLLFFSARACSTKIKQQRQMVLGFERKCSNA